MPRADYQVLGLAGLGQRTEDISDHRMTEIERFEQLRRSDWSIDFIKPLAEIPCASPQPKRSHELGGYLNQRNARL